jgi:hypothetical protein
LQGNTLALLMKDRKSLYLLIFALIVITVAFTLISVWGYRFYFSKKNPHSPIASLNRNASINKKTDDGRKQQLPLDSAIRELNNPADTIAYDSSDHQLALKIMQFNKLKNEIALILKERYSAKDSTAETKIAALERNIEELRTQNTAITKENARLNEMVTQLLEKTQKEKEQKPAYGQSKQQPALSLPLLVSHLRFGAYNNDQKTWLASEAKRLVGSFEINVKAENRATEIYIVIIKPNGQVLLNASGSAATFNTNTGRKTYSAVVHFDNAKDNRKRLQFSVNSNQFNKGKYIMQIYHQGIMIGRLQSILY